MILSQIKEYLIQKAIEKSGKNITPCGSQIAGKTLLDDKNFTCMIGKNGTREIIFWYNTKDTSTHLVKFFNTVEEAVSA